MSKNISRVLLFLSVWAILYSFYLLTNRDQTEKNNELSALFSQSKHQVLGMASKSSDCKTQGPLPDHDCTPGAIFGNATKEQICVDGYTRTVRKVSAKLKKEIYAEYGISYPTAHGSFEVDHLIPLALGGNNDTANLWPEAANPLPGFKEKDLVEIYLQQEVCAGRVDLKAAQMAMAANWTQVYKNLSQEKISEIKSKYKSWAN